MRTSASRTASPQMTPRATLAHRRTLPSSTSRAEAAKNLPSGVRTRACTFNLVASSSAVARDPSMAQRCPRAVPKVIPEEIKARIVSLLQEKRTGAEIVEVVAQEFSGYSISARSVTALAPRAGVKLLAARRPTPRRELARLRRQQGLTETAIAAELGISKQRVSKLLSDDK